MHIRDILRPGNTAFSFELFPPRTAEARADLEGVVDDLVALAPAFVSVTYGAGGSTRDATRALAHGLARRPGVEPVPHLTCVGHGTGEIDALLEGYARAGIGNLLALRGDPPAAGSGGRGDFRRAADLVRHLRRFNDARRHPEPQGFGIGVAGFPEGHPDTPNRLLEMDFLKAKVDAGADYVCTQLFFDNRDFLDFRDRCGLAGIRVPILAGILPITSAGGMRRLAELAGGARFPAPLLRKLAAAVDDHAAREIGLEHATEQCAGLLANGVAGVHLYTLNQVATIRRLFANLGRGQPAGRAR